MAKETQQNSEGADKPEMVKLRIRVDANGRPASSGVYPFGERIGPNEVFEAEKSFAMQLIKAGRVEVVLE